MLEAISAHLAAQLLFAKKTELTMNSRLNWENGKLALSFHYTDARTFHVLEDFIRSGEQQGAIDCTLAIQPDSQELCNCEFSMPLTTEDGNLLLLRGPSCRISLEKFSEELQQAFDGFVQTINDFAPRYQQ